MSDQSLHYDFSIIAMLSQTIKDKWKYKLQELFKMLFLSLDTCLESLFPQVWALSMMVSSPDLKHSQLQFRSHIGFLYMVRAASWCCCCHGNRTVGTQPIKLFKCSQSATKCRCILWKKYSWRAYFHEVIPTCFRGPVFLYY